MPERVVSIGSTGTFSRSSCLGQTGWRRARAALPLRHLDQPARSPHPARILHVHGRHDMNVDISKNDCKEQIENYIIKTAPPRYRATEEKPRRFFARLSGLAFPAPPTQLRQVFAGRGRPPRATQRSLRFLCALCVSAAKLFVSKGLANAPIFPTRPQPVEIQQPFTVYGLVSPEKPPFPGA